jgi:hypothetical protein
MGAQESEMKDDKRFIDLQSLQNNFRNQLVPGLKSAAKGKNSLLFAVSNLENRKYWFPQNQNPLYEDAVKIESLKTELALNDGHSLSFRFIHCCEEFDDSKNPHRRGAKKLAELLLSEIENEKF